MGVRKRATILRARKTYPSSKSIACSFGGGGKKVKTIGKARISSSTMKKKLKRGKVSGENKMVQRKGEGFTGEGEPPLWERKRSK